MISKTTTPSLTYRLLSSSKLVQRHYKNAIRFVALALLVCCVAVAAPSISYSQTTIKISEETKVGVEAYERHEFVEASKLLKQAVKKHPTDQIGWYYLGLSLMPQSKFKDSTKALETAIKLQPNFAAAHAALAFALLNRDKLLDANRSAKAALALDPKMADAHYVLGVVQLRLNFKNDALQIAETAIKIDPKFGPAYLLKSRALVSFLQDVLVMPPPEPRETRTARYQEAADALEKYLQLSPHAEDKQLWTEQLESLRFHAQSSGPGVKRAVFTAKEVTTKARVLSKPAPSYTEVARANGVSGVVILRCVFAADGTVKHFLVIAGLPLGLTEAAINAAKKIKFAPATIDGQPVSMFIQLEYNFHLF